MTESEKLLDAMSELDGWAVLEAGRARKRRAGTGRRLLAAGAVAAALCVAFIPWHRANGLTERSFDSIEQVEELYGGTLLAEDIAGSGAELTSIRLSHREDTDVSDTSGWDSLRLAGEMNGEPVEISCAFNAPDDPPLPGEPTQTLDYNGVTVYLYLSDFDEWGERYNYACEAVFQYGGVRYDMSVRLREREDIGEFLDMVIESGGESAEYSRIDSLDSVLGFEDYRVTLEEAAPWTRIWHFWVELDGVETCVAETFGSDVDWFGAYSVDMDGDGVPELVTNNEYADGALRVYVYKIADGVIMRGYTDWKYYENELGFDMLVGAACVAEERYDPEKNEFVVVNYGSKETKTATFTGPEHFEFLPFEHS